MAKLHSAIIELRMYKNGVFLVPVKYTLVCCVQCCTPTEFLSPVNFLPIIGDDWQ